MRLILYTLVLVCLLCPLKSTASNIVQNPSFESGYSGWSVIAGFSTVSMVAAVDGTRSLVLSANNSPGIVRQTVTTVPGQDYDLSFWLANYSVARPSVQVDWGSTTVLTLTGTPIYDFQLSSQWHSYAVPSLRATSTATALTFTFVSSQGLFLDSVSLTPEEAATPEPASAILLGAALLTLFWFRASRSAA